MLNASFVRTPLLLAGLLLSGLLLAGCSSQRVVRVASYPTGAVIWVDEKRVGQTDNEKVLFDFSKKREITVRVEMDGYHPKGEIVSIKELDRNDRKALFYVLEKSPDNDGIRGQLKSIDGHLEKISTNLQQSLEGRKDR